MIIYNHKKEFIGIDEKDLRALRLANLAELQNEAGDFADLFVKTPGHIHNFKNVHWIDFITTADSLEENKVVISVKGKHYRAIVDIQTIYLVDAPANVAYGVVLNGLRELTKEEAQKISPDLAQHEVQPHTTQEVPTVGAVAAADTQEEGVEEPLVVADPYDDLHRDAQESVALSEEKEPLEEEAPLTLLIDEDETKEDTSESRRREDEPITLEEDVFGDAALKDETHTPHIETTEEVSTPQTKASEDSLSVDEKILSYRYDPKLASDELGLPVDLVEEFIQDFIAQSLEFKPKLYEALENGEIDNVRMLSHKLKGVAANLRIEDAFETLVTINTSEDINVVKQALDTFYDVIIKKLAHEEIVVDAPTQPQNDDIEAPYEKTPDDSDEEKIDIVLEDETPSQEEAVESQAKVNEEVDRETKQENSQEEMPQETSGDDEGELAIEILPDDEEQSTNEEETVNEEEARQGTNFDVTSAAQRMGIDPQRYRELLKDFRTDVSQETARLRELIESGASHEEIAKAALRLKGMCDNMQVEEIAESLKALISQEDIDKTAALRTIEEQFETFFRMV